MGGGPPRATEEDVVEVVERATRASSSGGLRGKDERVFATSSPVEVSSHNKLSVLKQPGGCHRKHPGGKARKQPGGLVVGGGVGAPAALA